MKRVLAWVHGLPRIVVVPILLIVALTAWVFASPVGSSPDDDFHLGSIWCAAGDREFACEPAGKPTERLVPEVVAHGQHCYARDDEASAACQESLFDAGSTADTLTDRGSFVNQYPPVYYFTMGLLVTPDVSLSIILMRLLNVILFVGIGVALFRLLPGPRRAPMVWGWALTSVPLSIFLIASNNPSSWAIIGLGAAWPALLGYLETSGRRKVALGALFALAVVMAAGARGDAAIYVVLSMGIVLVLTFRRDRAYLLDAILPIVMALVAIAFFLTTQQAGVVQNGLRDDENGAYSLSVGAWISLLGFNLLNLPSLWVGALGGWGLGWLDTIMPHVVVVGAGITFLVAAGIGVGREWPRKIIAVSLLVLGIWLIPTFVLVQGGMHVGDSVQPRYILPFMIVLAGVAMLVRDRPLVWGRYQLVVIGSALVAANTVALHTNIRRYVTGVDEQGWNLDAGREWWWNVPFSPMADWIVGSVAFGALIVLLGRAAWRSSVAAIAAPDVVLDAGALRP